MCSAGRHPSEFVAWSACPIRVLLAALEQAEARVADCEREHPPEPEYVAWEEAGKPDGLKFRELEAKLAEATDAE